MWRRVLARAKISAKQMHVDDAFALWVALALFIECLSGACRGAARVCLCGV